MSVGLVGVERIASFMGVEFVVVHVLIDACVLTNFAYSPKTGFSQIRLLRSVFEPQTQGVACPK